MRESKAPDLGGSHSFGSTGGNKKGFLCLLGSRSRRLGIMPYQEQEPCLLTKVSLPLLRIFIIQGIAFFGFRGSLQYSLMALRNHSTGPPSSVTGLILSFLPAYKFFQLDSLSCLDPVDPFFSLADFT